MNRIILDLCGGTGAWSKPYKDARYDVRNITLPEFDVRIYKPPKNVHGILAAPPCPMFSLARSTPKIPRNLKQGMELVIACLKIIWKCRYENKLAFWCIENPMGLLRQFLGKPVFSFHPWNFGDPWEKRTDLWGYFNIPRVKYKSINDFPKLFLPKTCRINKSGMPSVCDIWRAPTKRAITPSGFAKAFFKANP